MKHLSAPFRTVLLLLLTTGLMGIGACKQSEKSASEGEGVPPDLKIMFGLHGMGAGRSMGYTINGDGEVIRWEGRYPEENREDSATVGSDDVRRLWQHAERIGFLEMQEQAMAASYWFVSVSANGESRRVTWVERDEDAPTPAQEFFLACRDVARAALRED